MRSQKGNLILDKYWSLPFTYMYNEHVKLQEPTAIHKTNKIQKGVHTYPVNEMPANANRNKVFWSFIFHLRLLHFQDWISDAK